MGCSSISATSAAAIILSAIAISLQISSCGAFQFAFSDSLRVHGRMSAASASSSEDHRPTEWLYDVPNSSWTSAEWNWGYASGTGHDCAAICRRKFATRSSRAEFIRSLLDPSTPQPPSFEEVKLVLGLAVQRGRWDGSDGGPGGYGDVLAAMTSARRYETDGTEENRMVNFVEDMRHRFGLLNPSKEDAEMMKSLDGCNGDATIDELNAARRMCSGLVLMNMDFIDNGL